MFRKMFLGACRYLDDGEGGGGGGTQGTPPKTYDEKYVTDLRTEAANYRTKAKEAKDALDALTTQHTELKGQHNALVTEVQEARVKSTVSGALIAAGTTKPDAVFTLVRDQIKLDAENKVDPKEMQKVIDAAVKEYPEFFKSRPGPRQIDAANSNNNPPGFDMNRMIRQAAGYE